MAIVVVSSPPGAPQVRPAAELPVRGGGEASSPIDGQDFATILSRVPAATDCALPEPPRGKGDEQTGDNAPPGAVGDPFAALLGAPLAAPPIAPTIARSDDAVPMTPEDKSATKPIALSLRSANDEALVRRPDSDGAAQSASAELPALARPARFAVAETIAAASGPAAERDGDLAAAPNRPGTPLQAALPLAAPTSPPGHATSATIPTAVGAPAWAGEFADRVLWFVRNDREFARLSLTPPELGRIDIRLDIDKDTASASFVSTSPEVRSAIEAAVPRLREMFASAGIDLGQVAVGSEAFSQSSQSGRQADPPPRPFADNAILGSMPGDEPGVRPMNLRSGSGLVDIFA
ncbi:flagellar hook-length control protein FliK [Accumulibacter sp.]|uniref:flagellar hook-length control protein FliK n=1 Tax=Accumulibacter sp. TaxID=2053492 RepID=UPI0025E50DC3|nr:flagellar hook-length control protein FliK [Accumulibacter sp.]MCM8596255.1 flagellar hook-length control protein FliK [Accumulibacter sp.]MCM8627186.1 flagellar hook-length control protein FliK [Accumulibacter sp.]MDS4050404.1 flagellar hook-length control protein FliK [Accumulibacter sp.]